MFDVNSVALTLDVALIVLLLCFFMHVVFSEALKKRLLKKPILYDYFFTKTKTVAIGFPRIELPSSIRLKHFVPFKSSTDECDFVEKIYLNTSRISVWIGFGVLVYMFL